MSIVRFSGGQYAPRRLLQGAHDLYRDGGIRSVVDVGMQFTQYWLRIGYTTVIYRLQYGEAAPRVGEVQYIDPNEIKYVINRVVPRNAPPFGVIDGSWDEQKVHRFRHGVMWQGLLERYRDDKPWEETTYYRRGHERIANGETLRVMDGDTPTHEEFDEYMHHLDAVAEQMRQTGFDDSAVVPVALDRRGEWMLYGDGNHRTTIAQGIGIESIPVCILYRHKDWQSIRHEVVNTERYPELSEAARSVLDHADVEPLTPEFWCNPEWPE